jgi:hypothetical protein
MLRRVARVHATGRIPGEVSGPAIAVNLQLHDTGQAPVALAGTVAVTAEDAAGTPFVPLTTSTTAVTGTLAPGAHTHGTYVFHLPSGYRNPITVEVTYAAAAEVARFVGSIS